jgi:hypothetical protein
LASRRSIAATTITNIVVLGHRSNLPNLMRKADVFALRSSPLPVISSDGSAVR